MTWVAFRADASYRTGVGHVMRCLSLADELRRRGLRSVLICREIPDAVKVIVQSRGVELRMMSRDGSDDVARSVDALGDVRPRAVVVDSYALDGTYEAAFCEALGSPRVLAIDDLADRPHTADMVLDQNLFDDAAGRYNPHVRPATRLLLGPTYALLRSQFAVCRARGIVPERGRVLVLFGGTDPTGETVRIARAFVAHTGLDLVRRLDLVVGGGHQSLSELAELARIEPRFRLHVQVEDVAELMASAELAIGAGGTTSWERCCVGLPTLVASIADNQVGISEALDRAGACRYLGRSSEFSDAQLVAALIHALEDRSGLAEMRRRGLALVDGQGAGRVADALLEGA